MIYTPGTNVIKLLTSLIYAFLHYAGVFVPGWPFQPGLMFVGKARSERCFTWVGSGLTRKHYTWLENPIRDKDSILLLNFVNY
jgi:hypothetical protein